MQLQTHLNRLDNYDGLYKGEEKRAEPLLRHKLPPLQTVEEDNKGGDSNAKIG